MADRALEVPPGFRDAVWVSRCVGRAESARLRPHDLEGLAQFLSVRTLEADEPLHHIGGKPAGSPRRTDAAPAPSTS